MKEIRIGILNEAASQSSAEVFPHLTQLGHNPRISLELAPLTGDVGKAGHHLQQVFCATVHHTASPRFMYKYFTLTSDPLSTICILTPQNLQAILPQPTTPSIHHQQCLYSDPKELSPPKPSRRQQHIRPRSQDFSVTVNLKSR
jgi:hypothetical protein